jgi:uncharacterized phiE125 gp8 family phage protein
VSVGPYALCSRDSLKRWLSVRPSQGDNDELLDELIDMATAIIEKTTSRRLKSRAYVNDLTSFHSDGSQTDTLWLVEFPVVSVQQVIIDGGVMASTDYKVYPESGYIRLARRVTTYLSQPQATVIVPDGVQNVRVDYTAGFATVPPDLVQACRDLAAHMFIMSHASDKRTGIISRSIGDKSEQFIDDTTIPPRVEQLIAPYRRVEMISHREESPV